MQTITACMAGMCASGLCACKTKGKTAKIAHLGLLALGTALSLSFKYWGVSLLSKIPGIGSDCSNACIEDQIVYRISASLALFFFLCSLLSRCTVAFHNGCWFLKVFFLVVCIIGSLWLPVSVFLVYAKFARVISVIFLIIQIMLLIDFAYNWNESWVNKDDQENGDIESVGPWAKAVLSIAFALYIFSFTAWILMFKHMGGSGCALVNFFITLTILSSIGLTAITISSICPHGALLTTAVVTAWSTANSIDIFHTSISEEETARIQGGKSIVNDVESNMDDLDKNAPLLSNQKDHMQVVQSSKEQENQESQENEDPEDKPDPEAAAFHLILAVAAVYLAMLLTNWGYLTSESTNNAYDIGKPSMWSKIISQWITLVLYFWTLTAPACFPDRQF